MSMNEELNESKWEFLDKKSNDLLGTFFEIPEEFKELINELSHSETIKLFLMSLNNFICNTLFNLLSDNYKKEFRQNMYDEDKINESLNNIIETFLKIPFIKLYLKELLKDELI